MNKQSKAAIWIFITCVFSFVLTAVTSDLMAEKADAIDLVVALSALGTIISFFFTLVIVSKEELEEEEDEEKGEED